MNKVLITKLNGVVSNDDLPRVGEIRLDVDYTGEDDYYRNHVQAISLVDNSVINVLFNDGISIKEGYVEGKGISSNISGKGVIKIYPKYNLTSIESRIATTLRDTEESLKYCEQLVELILTGSNKLNLDKIDYTLPKLEILSFDWSNGLSGDIRKLTSFAPNLKTLFVNGCTLLTGDISDIGALTKLEKLDFASSGVTGTVESFVAAQREAGKTTCTLIVFQNAQDTITFNGGAITSGAKLSWTSTTITLDNSTIEA